MKVFVYIGSRKGEKSSTYNIARILLDRIKKELKEDYSEYIVTPDKHKIEFCRSCNICFGTGKCAISDDMNFIKERMEEADIILWGSPVYLHNVSGDMKVFIDRISSWAHLFKLHGKKSITVSASASNGNSHVDSYLVNTLESLGCESVCNLSVTLGDPNMLEDRYFVEDEISKYSRDIISKYYSSEVKTSEHQEGLFRGLKNVYTNESQSFEGEYWRTSGLDRCESYKEFLLRRKN